jgi:protein-ribulosamine 3-kinase
MKKKFEIVLKFEAEKPLTLYGDFRAGNIIVDKNARTCLIDTTVYYGNREVDLATTKFFGGFTKEF